MDLIDISSYICTVRFSRGGLKRVHQHRQGARGGFLSVLVEANKSERSELIGRARRANLAKLASEASDTWNLANLAKLIGRCEAIA
jgi:hypothetical protein